MNPVEKTLIEGWKTILANESYNRVKEGYDTKTELYFWKKDVADIHEQVTKIMAGDNSF